MGYNLMWHLHFNALSYIRHLSKLLCDRFISLSVLWFSIWWSELWNEFLRQFFSGQMTRIAHKRGWMWFVCSSSHVAHCCILMWSLLTSICKQQYCVPKVYYIMAPVYQSLFYTKHNYKCNTLTSSRKYWGENKAVAFMFWLSVCVSS